MPEIDQLNQIPGIGATLAKNLVDIFGSEQAAIKIILNAQVATLASILGVGKKKALAVVKDAYTLREGVEPFEVLKTEDILQLTNVPVRVDGIETSGLVLIFNPKNSIIAK
ncbi:MAG: helix-hairpin-helix domain-containing protein [Promethearchaeota archaeon]